MSEQPAEEDYSSLPITARVEHKLWKVRLAAYEEAAKQFATSASENDPCFRVWLQDPGIWRGVLKDNNVMAQEAGVDALWNFLKYGGSTACIRTRSQVIGILVEKCLAANKASTKSKALGVLQLFIESDTADPVIEELLNALCAKLPKLVAAALSALKDILKMFGTKVVDPKPVLKQLVKCFSHSDRNVRCEANFLTVELYRWLGDAIRPFLIDLKPVQLKELDELISKVEPCSARPEKTLESANQNEVNDGTNVNADADKLVEKLDAFNLTDPVDVITKIPKDFSNTLSSVKWKDRKDALDALLTTISVQKIQDDNFMEIITILAKCMKDANIAVVTVAAQCVTAFAMGLRSSFSRYRSVIMQPMIEKLKERKQTVIEALSSALDATFMACGLSDILEDVLGGLIHKNPQVKTETLKFLVRCLRNTPVIPNKNDIKLIAEASVKLIGDTYEPVRAAAAEALGVLMKVAGDRAINLYIESIDDIRKIKVKEHYDSAIVKAKAEVPTTKQSNMRARACARNAPKPANAQIVRDEAHKIPSNRNPSGQKLSNVRSGSISTVKHSTQRIGSPLNRSKLSATDDSSGNLIKSYASRGLVARPLNQTDKISAEKPVLDLCATERSELEQLRQEKNKRFMSEDHPKSAIVDAQKQIMDLQLKVAKLLEDNAAMSLQMQAKDAKISELVTINEVAQSELSKARKEIIVLRLDDTSREQIKRLEDQLDRSDKRASETQKLYKSIRERYENIENAMDSSDQFAPLRRAEQRCKNLEEQNERLIRDLEYQKNIDYNETALDFGPNKENSKLHVSRLAAQTSPPPVHSWKSAAEVTAALKLKIEQMKRVDSSRSDRT